ncbi:endonuclease/exonuclease/phosphatase family protein [Candidatus Saccharibacteria bacterium]|jgi:endonuclease/exonuclease/phosphatase (EEP) superfamily protein YafD|nr:endonuclease/exonuclease/phosphatase family protein [Candidatus Saccharibacteria bacterium]
MKAGVRLRWQVYILGLILLGQTIVLFSFFVPFFLGEMIISFLPYEFILSIVGLALVRNRNTPIVPLAMATAWIFCVGFYLLAIGLPVSNIRSISVNSHQSIRVASYNKLVLSQLNKSTLNQLSSKHYDVLTVVELEPHNYQKIAKNWKYSIRTDCACDPASEKKTSELAIFSSFPLSKKLNDQDIIKHGGSQLPAELNFHGQKIDLLAVHPDAPYTKQKSYKQDLQLRQLQSQFEKISTPTVIMGDFNLTAFSPRYRNLFDDANLYDAGFNQGFKITWCFNEAKFFCAPIDHILSNGFLVNYYGVKKIGNSDHRLIEANLVLK